MIGRLFLLFLAMFASHAMGAVRTYYMQTTGPLAGEVVVHFIDKVTGTPVDLISVVGETGHLTLSLTVDQDPSVTQRYGADGGLPLQPQITADGFAVTLPIPLPEVVGTEGYIGRIRLVFHSGDGATLGWTHTLDLNDPNPLIEALGTTAADKLLALAGANRLSQTQVDRIIAQLSQPAFDNPCVTYFDGQRGLLSVNNAHCATTASPLLAPIQFDTFCSSNTQGLLKDLLIVAQMLCPIDALVAKAVAPAQQEKLKALVVNQWLASLDNGQAADVPWYDVAQQLGRWAPARQNDLTSFAYYVNQLAEQRAASDANQRWFSSQTEFRDTLMSELIRASVTQHFKMRGEFSQWCANESGRADAEALCFQFSTDVAVRLVTIFGFEQLPAFNQSVSIHREAYIKWVNSVLDRSLAANSMAFLTDWSIDFARSHFEALDCGSQLLFPIGAIKARGEVPNLALLADSQSAAYQAYVDRMARDFERFIQSLWEQFGGAEYVDQRRAASCAEKTMDTAAFQVLMPQ